MIKWLGQQGYDSLIEDKLSGMMAQAIFYKSKLKLLQKRKILLEQRGLSFVLAAHLQELESGIELVFASTHLKAMPEFERMRMREVRNILQQFASQYANLPVP